MKILVLGGTGAMGVPVVRILAQRGHDVFVTSRKQRSDKSGIHYLQGNAHESTFVQGLLAQKFDVIIDFMVYSSEEFQSRVDQFLKNSKQYIFLSSARVYADEGNQRITEDSARLLDVTTDKDYIKTDEYALAKAREENILQCSDSRNWTIIRPYITYNDNRLQLGVLEKESWLQRALEGKAIVFSKDIAAHYTTLTYGYDVSLRIADLVGVSDALGQVFHIASGQYIKWEEVLEIYLKVLENQTGCRPKVFMFEDSSLIAKTYFNKYQIQYDRLFDRKFDNKKIQDITKEPMPFKDVEIGLTECLERFLRSNRSFLGRNWRAEGAFDRVTGDKQLLSDIPGHKNKIKYFLYRYLL